MLEANPARSGRGRPRAAGLDETVVAVLAPVKDRDTLRSGVGEDDELVAQQVELHDGVLDHHGARAERLVLDDAEARRRSRLLGGAPRLAERLAPPRLRLELLSRNDDLAE